MKTPNDKDIRKVMKKLSTSCRDNTTGEMNYTLLAESACADLDAYVGDNIPDTFFDLAIEFDLPNIER